MSKTAKVGLSASNVNTTKLSLGLITLGFSSEVQNICWSMFTDGLQLVMRAFTCFLNVIYIPGMSVFSCKRLCTAIHTLLAGEMVKYILGPPTGEIPVSFASLVFIQHLYKLLGPFSLPFLVENCLPSFSLSHPVYLI